MADSFDSNDNNMVLPLYRQALEQLPVGVCLFDRDDRLLYANVCLADWLGVRHAELIGRSWQSLLVGQLNVNQRDPALLNIPVPLHLQRHDGSPLAVDVSFAPLPTPGLTVATLWRRMDRSRESSVWFDALCAGSTAIKLLIDPRNGAIREANAAAAQFYGYARAELCALTLADLDCHPGYALDALLQQAAQAPAPAYRRQQRTRSGEQRSVDLFCGPAQLPDRPGLLVVVHDVSAQQRIAADAERLALALAHSPVAVYITDSSGLIRYCNRRGEQLADALHRAQDSSDRTRLPLLNLLAPAQLAQVHQAMQNAQEWRGECAGEPDGETQWLALHLSPAQDDGQGLRCLWVAEDITRQRQQEQVIRRQANFDTLTGLPNRLLAQDRLEQALREAQRDGEKCALLYIDLDDFKKINESLGHETGDQILVQAGQRLRQAVREADTVARVGGDEFLIILSKLLHPDDAIPAAEKLLRALAQPFDVESGELVLSASIGITLCPDDGQDWRTLLQHADMAMYSAKGEGRNTYRFFTRTMNLHTRRRLRVEQSLRQAISRNELQVYYQPVMALGSGRLVGAEALLRWHNTTLGEVAPGEFITIAEQTGLINPIGEFVLNAACRQFRHWQDEGLKLEKLAVNASPRQIRDGGFIQSVNAALADSGLGADHLYVEITESLLLNRQADVKRQLNQLRERGLHLCMDDFGTGFSSLSYLKHFPFQSIKIDRAFIKDMDRDADDRELVTAIIAMAKALRLQVVAEGVEKRAHLDLLGALGCEYAQGYLIARPMPADKFGQFARERLATLPLF